MFVLGPGQIQVLPGADPASFELSGHWYAKDAGQVYREDDGVVTILPGADPASFEPLDHLFARDGAQVFCRATPIAGADVDSFVAMPHGHARDRHRCYRCDGGKAVVVDRVEPPPDDVPF